MAAGRRRKRVGAYLQLTSFSTGVRLCTSDLNPRYLNNDYVYGYASYDEDHFSGFDFQVATSLGWGHRIINKEDMEWDVEIGPGYRFSKVDSGIAVGDVSEEVILRLFTSYPVGLI